LKIPTPPEQHPKVPPNFSMNPRTILLTAFFTSVAMVHAAHPAQPSNDGAAGGDSSTDESGGSFSPPALAPKAPKSSGPIEVNGIAAKVNGRIVTKSEVAFMLAPLHAQLVAQFPRRGAEYDRQLKSARDKILQELIDREIILDEFRQMGASLKPQYIDEEIARQIREVYNGNKATLLEELKKSHLTMDGYREMTREKLVVQAIRSQHFSDAPPPLPREIEREYDEVKPLIRDMAQDKLSFQKIFIPRADPNSEVASPEVQLTLAESLFAKLQKGENFDEIAKANSKDAFADKGGLQNDVPRTDLAPEFASILFDAPEGKILGPLEDPQGFTIVKVIKKSLGPVPPLSKVREMIEERVRRKKTSTSYERWINSQRKRAMIVLKV
jgi:parvulin-like peptidyl-prolyl isomerase